MILEDEFFDELPSCINVKIIGRHKRRRDIEAEELEFPDRIYISYGEFGPEEFELSDRERKEILSLPEDLILGDRSESDRIRYKKEFESRKTYFAEVPGRQRREMRFESIYIYRPCVRISTGRVHILRGNGFDGESEDHEEE